MTQQQPQAPPPLPFLTPEVCDAAFDEWNFSCGPAAVCALTEMSPNDIRPYLFDFEQKGHTNPTLMKQILLALGLEIRSVFQPDADITEPPENPIYPEVGLVRIQWAGRWTGPGVPVRARYRKTHWVAVRPSTFPLRNPKSSPRDVFDVNAVRWGGWIPWRGWKDELVPWIIRECVKGGTGVWWPTHCWEVSGPLVEDLTKHPRLRRG